MPSPTDLAGVPGVPETVLGRALLDALPESRAPAPWSCSCEAVLWFGRGSRAATAALPQALRRTSRGRGVVGGMVGYRDTPVGAYDEVFGAVGSRTGLRPWGSVAFMAVDSPASLVGGRENWGLPKTLAAFEGEVTGGSGVTARGADLVGWRVAVSSRSLGPAVPARVSGEVRQVLPDGRIGRSRLSVHARVRPALVTVEVVSEGPLASWLRPGRHLGVVVQEATLTLATPR